MSQHAPSTTIRTGLRPGDIGRITAVHGVVYAAEWGWDETFEAYVAEGLARFALAFDPATNRIWIAEDDAGFAGSIAIVDAGGGAAQLRWFLVDPRARGCGLGGELMDRAMDFCRSAGFDSVFLVTVRGLDAAARLYRKAGFSLTEERTHEPWGGVVTEQRFEMRLRNSRRGA